MKISITNKFYIVKYVSLIIFLVTNLLIAQDPTVGLIYHDNTKSFQGYTLFGAKNDTATYLIDNDGILINEWVTDYNPASTAYLLEDGTLLRSTRLTDPDGGRGGFQVLEWDGSVIWEYIYGRQHHDIEPHPNGNVLLITNAIIDSVDAINTGRDPSLLSGNVTSLKIVEIQNNNGIGEIVWEWNAWDHLVQDFDPTKPNFDDVATHPELIDLNYVPNINSNWLHVNAIDYNSTFDQILVSFKSYNELIVIDHSTTTEEAASHSGGNSGKGGDVLYRWGNPAAYRAGTADDQQLFGQHDTRWVDSGLPGEGNLMVFNNGLNRPEGAYSSILEITPPVDNLGNYSHTAGTAYEPSLPTWEYSALTPTDMYSSKFSGAHRLPNGNTQICNGVGGELIEVTETGEIVWQYINPATPDGFLMQDDDIQNNDVFRSHRYSPDFVGFAGRDLSAGIKLDVADENSVIKNFKLFNNFPNPFNPTTNITFSIDKQEYVNIIIYDMLGNTVRTLVNDLTEPGLRSVVWDSRDDYGISVSSGVYLYSLRVGSNISTKKMILLR